MAADTTIKLPPAKHLFSDLFDSKTGDVKNSKHLVERQQDLITSMTKATADGMVGNTILDTNATESVAVVKTIDKVVMKGAGNARSSMQFAKEWTLSNPIPSGLVPFDLEAPAKLLAPRPTPLRNSIPRLRGTGSSRRFKVISGFTGTGTGGMTTIQPGITESTTNVGPGGLSYIRGPQISYAGTDVTLNYVTTSLTDVVSWQAEYQGSGFEDIRSLSNTALLYSTMLLDERLMIYGRGTSANGYTGALTAPSGITCTAVSASLAPGGSSTLGSSATVWVLVAADAGDLLGTNGGMHQGPTSSITTGASVTTSAGLTAVQVKIGSDVQGALGYNLFVASVQAGPYYYAGRTGYNVGYITYQPPLAGQPSATTTAGAADASAVATNYDGLLTNVAASGGYVARLNAPFSTTSPGVEYQVAFASLYENVKADPEEIWINGFDRMQLSNAMLNNAQNSAYNVFIDNSNGMNHSAVGAVVTTIYNQVTGSAVDLRVHPWFPQGNSLVRSVTLPIPDSNVAETSCMVLPQDYCIINWASTQFTYDASSFEIGTMAHYAPAWSAVVSGIQGVGVSQTPPSLGDS